MYFWLDAKDIYIVSTGAYLLLRNQLNANCMVSGPWGEGTWDKSIYVGIYQKYKSIPRSIQGGQRDDEGIRRGRCCG